MFIQCCIKRLEYSATLKAGGRHHNYGAKSDNLGLTTLCFRDCDNMQCYQFFLVVS